MLKYLLLLTIMVSTCALRGSAQTTVTNTANSLVVTGGGCSIPSGSYNIKYEIEDIDGIVTEFGPSPCTVTTTTGGSGSINSISIPSANLPTDAVEGYSLFGENFYNGGAGPYGTKSRFELYVGSSLYTIIVIEYNYAGCPVLPIYLGSFGGMQMGSVVDLGWTTVFEQDASHFVVERNGVILGPVNTKIGTVAAAGNSSSTLYYTYTDNYPLNGTNSYRLRMVDLNGTFRFSDVEDIACTGCTATAPEADCSGVTLTGPSNLCYLGATYTLSNVPNYTTPKWSISDETKMTWGGSDMEKAWVKKVGIGSSTIQATIAGCTAATKVKTKTIKVGQPELEITVLGITCGTKNAVWQLEGTLFSGTTNSDYVWYRNGVYHSTGRTTTANSGALSASMQLQVTTPCGLLTKSININITPCTSGRSAGLTTAAEPCKTEIGLQVDPVPASSNMRITLSSDPSCELQKAAHPYSVEMTDIYGLRKKQQRLNIVKGTESIDISTIPNGIYVLRILDKTGKPVATKEVKILH
jgi:hypothetical protein